MEKGLQGRRDNRRQGHRGAFAGQGYENTARPQGSPRRHSR